MIIYRSFKFDAAYFLPYDPEKHACAKMHGHTYTLKVFICGEIDPETFLLRDFDELRTVVSSATDILDHQVLNDVDELENPTCENILIWLWDRMRPFLPDLVKLELNETPTSGAIYQGQDYLINSFS